MKELCFVLMPFGLKKDPQGKEIDFDKVYQSFIKPAIEKAGLEPVRADEDKGGGFIHKPMYERLLYCDFAVADLSFANPNVFYELGIRHAIKPYTTVSLFEVNTRLPFDVAPLRTLPYSYENGAIANVQDCIDSLASRIADNLDASKNTDSPIAQLISGFTFPDLSGLRNGSETFQTWRNTIKGTVTQIGEAKATWSTLEKEKKALAKGSPEYAAVETAQQAIVQQLSTLAGDADEQSYQGYDIFFALIEAFKSMGAFKEMAAAIEQIEPERRERHLFLQQQLALALNKSGERMQAEAVLAKLIEQFGNDPETNGLLGAVYKGLMDEHSETDTLMADEYRRQAIETYLAGYESDIRDFYPGINALNLLFLSGDSERFEKYAPVVAFALELEARKKPRDYWVLATQLELAVLRGKPTEANTCLARALVVQPEKWKRSTTAANLTKIRNKLQETSGADTAWIETIITKLQ
jgi:tetratricopeptide (TPR) repeat protein